MKRSQMICQTCICRIDANPGDLMKDLCALGPVRVPVDPKHSCGSGKWREQRESQYGSIVNPILEPERIVSYGEWEEAE